MSHRPHNRISSVEERGLTIVKPRQTFPTLITLSEGQLESVLNLPIANVAGGIGQAKPAVAGRTRFHCRSRGRHATESTIGDYAVISSKVDVCTPKHWVIHQIEELQTELNSSLLAEELFAKRHAPIFENREIHVRNTRPAAITRTGIGISTQFEPIPGIGVSIQPLSPIAAAGHMAWFSEVPVWPGG